MRPDELFEKSICKKPWEKENPEQELLDAIQINNDEIERLRRLGIPEDQIQPLIEEVNMYCGDLEELLAA
jgi:hypothetical protein